MTPLPTQFPGRADQKVFQFTLIERQGDVCLLSKRKSNWKCDKFEVVFVQKRPQHVWPDGRIEPAREAMPYPELWGTGGWSFDTLPAARLKFETICKNTVS